METALHLNDKSSDAGTGEICRNLQLREDKKAAETYGGEPDVSRKNTFPAWGNQLSIGGWG